MATSARRGDMSAALASHFASKGVADLDASDRARAEYSSDASNYRVVPALVVFPHTAEEVVTLVELCLQERLPFTARGGGTSVAGNAVGAGVVADFSRHMGRRIEIDPEAEVASVDPGVILADLQEAAAPYGLRFGPDPSTASRASIGGMVGNNACGAHGIAWGRTADNLISLDAIDGTGRRFRTDEAPGSLSGEIGEFVARHRNTIESEMGRFSRQVSGYGLEHLLEAGPSGIARAIAGSEGTLALLLGAELRLLRPPPHTALAVLSFPTMAEAAEVVPEIAGRGVLALEAMDSRLMSPSSRSGLGVPSGRAWLLVETGGESQAEASRVAQEIAGLSRGASVVYGEKASARRLWRAREDGAALAARTPAGSAAWPGWEDAAVPPTSLPQYLRDFETLLRSHRLDGLLYGHFGEGCVHVRLDFPLGEDPSRLRSFVEGAAEVVVAHNGSLSGEHGDGRARSELLEKMYSPAALVAFSEFKALFDPHGILNPGVIVAPDRLDDGLRLASALPISRPGGLAFLSDSGDFQKAVHRCIGVGRCRADNSTSGGFMCPSFLATSNEKDSTRGRARVLQEMAQGTVVKMGWKDPAVKEALDLCLSCKACSVECPASVDMAAYKAEALYHRYRHRPRPAGHYSLGWLPRWAAIGSGSPGLANALLSLAERASVVHRVAGIDPARPFARLAQRSFWAGAGANLKTSSTRYGPGEALLWVDCLTGYFAPDIAWDAISVLSAAGYRIRLPSRRVCCGLSWYGTGQFGPARRRLRSLVEEFAPAAQSGIPIVGLEPSCTAVLRGDLVELLGADPKAAAVSQATRTMAEVLSGPCSKGRWRPEGLSGVAVVAQPHCHHHSVMGWQADEDLLASAGADVTRLAGCCGMAGGFGMERGHYELSVAVAERSYLPALRESPDAVAVADGFSCRLQAEHLLGRQPLHLAQVLAQSLLGQRNQQGRGPG